MKTKRKSFLINIGLSLLTLVAVTQAAWAECEPTFQAAQLACAVERWTETSYVVKRFSIETSPKVAIKNQPLSRTTGFLFTSDDSVSPDRLFVVTQDLVFGGIDLQMINAKSGKWIAAKSGGVQLYPTRITDSDFDLELSTTDPQFGVDFRLSCKQLYRIRQECI